VTATLKAFAYEPRCADLLLAADERIGQRFDALHRRLRSVPHLWGDADRQFRPRLVLPVGRLHRLHADAPLGRKRGWFLDWRSRIRCTTRHDPPPPPKPLPSAA